jgi:hypothetical protein
MRFETKVRASVVARSAREYAAQSGLQENSEAGEAAISAPVQVKVVQISVVNRICITIAKSTENC